MRTTWIAISLCLALLGAAGCTSAEDREKAELRAQIEAKLAEYEELHARWNAALAELRPDWPEMADHVTGAHRYALSNDPEPRLLRGSLESIEDSLAILRGQVERDEAQLAARNPL